MKEHQVMITHKTVDIRRFIKIHDISHRFYGVCPPVGIITQEIKLILPGKGIETDLCNKLRKRLQRSVYIAYNVGAHEHTPFFGQISSMKHPMHSGFLAWHMALPSSIRS